ncbi:YfbU family protein [Tenacibaculum dicentrarchi]|uniref:YfbU family protein n=1 Tax=Tenacibaculum dicentrarchi TaxID=669041 RepID=UPI000C7CCEAE|nr:conserved hypothetical protein [Tenacibaculum dicentrarchi]
MKFDIKERLQLSYQLKILEKLYPEDKDYYATHRKAIEYGFELHYDWIAEHLTKDTLSEDECKFVLDVLDMYASFYFSIKQLKEPKELTKSSVIFPGFDGNKEIMYMAYTRYFIEDLDRFNEIKESTNGNYNSHMRMITKYKIMVKKWKEFRVDFTYQLTEEQILELINTPVY